MYFCIVNSFMVMTLDFFNHLKVGDKLSGYVITKIKPTDGMIYAKNCSSGCHSFLLTHYSLFLVYNKITKKYE